MSSTTNKTKGQGLLAKLWADKHATTLAMGGVALSGASLWFNGNYGYEQGGIAMGAALLGFAIAKDGGISYAWGAQGRRGRVAAGLVGAIGFAISCMAALGASSHSREAAANPLQAQIDAYESAVKTEKEIEGKLSKLNGLTVAQAEGALAKVQVEPGIFKRTKQCVELTNKNDRITAVNREACATFLEAKAVLDAAKEVTDLEGKLTDARAVISKGRPASSDAQATSIAKFLGLDRIDGVQAILNVTLALSIEVIAPLLWAAYAGATSASVQNNPEPVRQQPTAPRAPVLSVVKGGRISDEEAEAIILSDLTKGIDRKQEEYAELFGKSVATISRMIDRLTSKPDAKIGEQWEGTRRKLVLVR